MWVGVQIYLSTIKRGSYCGNERAHSGFHAREA
jgi:hypothetical protein